MAILEMLEMFGNSTRTEHTQNNTAANAILNLSSFQKIDEELAAILPLEVHHAINKFSSSRSLVTHW